MAKPQATARRPQGPARPPRRRGGITWLLLLALACSGAEPETPALRREASEWASYGGDPGGQRYAVLDEITPRNVGDLEPAWTFHTGDVSDGGGAAAEGSAFELTPILADGLLFGCSPFNRVFALDPATGELRWRFDPEIDLSARYANQLVCRGVAHWRDSLAAPGSPCATRVFTATNDARLIALDAATGRRCEAFGRGGEIQLQPDAGETVRKGEYQVTSPPALIRDRVVVGSAVSDNQRTDAPSGVVRAFDARSGAELWAWDLAPPGFDPEREPTSRAGHALGTPNVWAPMSVDPERDLVFVPTGNAANDYYRGERAEANHYGSSVVALRGGTGQVAWHFPTVHRDLWDYDVPAQPTLTAISRDGAMVPAVVQATKMGLLFVLHRETGEPLHPVEERPVPQEGAPGERLSPTQPFPVRPPPLVRHRLARDDAWGLTVWDRNACRDLIGSLRSEGIYTPPSLQGSVAVPGNAGGSNWGGIAVHPERGIAIVNLIELAFGVRLVPRERYEAARSQLAGETAEQRGTPFALHRFRLLSPLGLPCNPPPWGTLAAVDLAAGEILWQVPLGTVRDVAPVPIPLRLGVPSLGGPVVTSSGVVFIAATMDDYLRAFDLASGEELWRARLPAGGQATPMLYRVGRRPYVVVAAGGHARAGTRLGDSLVAFSLPD